MQPLQQQQYPGKYHIIIIIIYTSLPHAIMEHLEPTHPGSAVAPPPRSAGGRVEDLIHNQREAWDYYLKYTKVSQCVSVSSYRISMKRSQS